MDLAAVLALTAALWQALPHGDTVWDLLETVAPFAFTEPMNTGGTVTGVPLFAGSEASSWTQTTFRLGIADVTDPGTGGRPLLYPDLSLVDHIRLTTAGTDLRSGTPGPLITLVPKAGGATWHRTVAVAFSPSPFQAEGSSATPPKARLSALGRAQADAGGPLTTRTHLFATAAGTSSSHVEQHDAFTLPGDVLSFAAHPTFELGGNRHADLSTWLQQTKTAFPGRALLRDRNADATQLYGGISGSWRSGVERLVEVSAAYAATRLTPGPPPAAARGTVDRVLDDPVEVLADITGGSRSRGSIAATFETGTRVHLSSGVSLAGAGMHASPFGTGLIGETVDGLPARAWDYGLAGEVHRSETAATAYASAQAQLIDTLEIDGGLRLEHVAGSAHGAPAGIAWTSLEPRLVLHYARGPFSGFIGARRYHPALTLSTLANGDPAGLSGRSYLWTDRNGDGQVQPDEVGALVSLAGPGSPTPGFSTIDPAIKRPHIDELQVAIDFHIKPWVSLRFSGASHKGGDLIGRFDTGVPFDAYSVRYQFDPGLNLGGPEDDQMLPVYSRPPATFGADRYVLQTIPNVKSTYGGLYVAVLFEKSPRWHLLAAATALHSYAPAAFRGHLPSENDELVVGDSYSDPNANTYSEGRTLFDRGYGLKVATAYNAPHRFTLAAVGRYADGQNFARLVVVPDLPQGPDIVRAYANGKSKFTFTATLDLRVQKMMTWGGRDVALGLESYNLTNLRNEVEEVVVTGPLWRQPTYTQPPRVIRLTVSTSF
ncbi:MAG TPA: hypothetical protein VGI12_08925 [Vicinamibacterales bacterium]|jgi:hypothetical protein